MANTASPKIILIAASEQHREEIYNIRYNVYAKELHQHSTNPVGQIKDDLDLFNNYIVAEYDKKIIGFISITSPASKKYSVDKYFNRSVVPYPFDEYLYEIRLLTVIKENRHSYLAYKETHVLRNNLKHSLLGLGITEIVEGVANFLLFYLPNNLEKLANFWNTANVITYL